MFAKNTRLKSRLGFVTETPWEALVVLEHALQCLMFRMKSDASDQKLMLSLRIKQLSYFVISRRFGRFQIVRHTHVDIQPRTKLLQWRYALHNSA